MLVFILRSIFVCLFQSNKVAYIILGGSSILKLTYPYKTGYYLFELDKSLLIRLSLRLTFEVYS